MNPTDRIVVTGAGVVSPVGNNVPDFTKAIFQGRSGIACVKSRDPASLSVKIAGEVKNLNFENFFSKKELRRFSRFIALGMIAADEAIQSSQLNFSNNDVSKNTAVIIGVGMGGIPFLEDQYKNILEQKKVSPFFIPAVISNLLPGHIGIKHQLQGAQFAVSSACASGAHAISTAATYIKQGLCDVAITGGSESTISSLVIEGFHAMKALSTNPDASKASRPWDKKRDGFVVSEGAGVIVLETLKHAKKRKAPILAELTGWGMSSDAYHISAPLSEGKGASLSMMRALNMSKLKPKDIHYINAHGTSTLAGDLAETHAIKTVFQDQSYQIPVSSIKGMIGHTLGAAGAIESIASIQAIQHSTIPPTINLEEPGDGCDLDYVPHKCREQKVTHVMSNSFGFGGTNISLIFSDF